MATSNFDNQSFFLALTAFHQNFSFYEKMLTAKLCDYLSRVLDPPDEIPGDEIPGDFVYPSSQAED